MKLINILERLACAASESQEMFHRILIQIILSDFSDKLRNSFQVPFIEEFHCN